MVAAAIGLSLASCLLGLMAVFYARYLEAEVASLTDEAERLRARVFLLESARLIEERWGAST